MQNNILKYKQLIFEFQISPKYTFDNFIVCDENKIAYKVSIDVSYHPLEGINPVYIYGESGTGKTHLLHAIGNFIKQSSPSLNLFCISSSDIFERYNYTLSYEEIISISGEYKIVDVLLIDDIHLINDMDIIQEQIFHIYNELIFKGKRIIVAGRKPPDQITGFNDYLKSRFLSGMVAGIRSNNDTVKKNILKKIALDENLVISDASAGYILNHFKRDIKEFQTIVHKINSYSMSSKRKVTPELIKEVINLE